MNLKGKMQKSTNLKRNKITIKEVKRQVKGITLIALVVTIIVLLILAGVALSLTVGNNGLFRRAENAANTWQIAEQNEQIEMDKASNFIEDYMNGGSGNNTQGGESGDESGITWHGDVPIPNGFYYVGGEENTGLIISDSPDDANKGDNLEASEYVGNQFVWVPVANPGNYFIDETATLNTNATGTGAENEVTTDVYSNLTISSEQQSRYTAVAPGTEATEDGDYVTVTREPDVLSRFDTNAENYDDILGFDSPIAMAESFVSEYKAMSNSIKKYNGFYIGRYELTGTVEKPTEKTGAPLNDQDWYNLYKACQNVVTGKENVKSTMIYGVQWDAVCSWLEDSGFDTDYSRSWGNYPESSGDANVEGAGSKQDTGFSEYWKANNIYDFAGNFWEFTQEAASTGTRFTRGGSYDPSGWSGFASARYGYNPPNTVVSISSRATLYMS